MEGTLTDGLRKWAEKNGIRPADFAKVTGFSYQHAHNVLRGMTEATDETLGRVARCYGADAVAEIIGPSQVQHTSDAVI
jgi:hypothetical protein